MGHILSEVFPFLGSVFQHWQIWLSGGGLGGLIVIAAALVEKLFGKSLSKRDHVYLFLVAFFLCACFLSWVDRDDLWDAEKQGRADDSRHYQEEIAKIQKNYDKLNSECQYKSGVLDTLTNQNRDQQNTINSCQTQALKLLTPPTFEMTPLRISDGTLGNGSHKAAFIILTNLPVTPVKMSVNCDRTIQVILQSVLGTSSPMNTEYGWGQTHEAPIEIDSPAWTAKTPLELDVVYVGQPGITCSFARQ